MSLMSLTAVELGRKIKEKEITANNKNTRHNSLRFIDFYRCKKYNQ